MFLIFLGLMGAIFTGFLFYQMVKKTSILFTGGIIFIVVGFALAGLLWARPQAKPSEKIFDIKAKQFAYEPGIIRVNRGDIVVLRFTSEDVTHGFYLDGYGIDEEIEPHKHEEEEETENTRAYKDEQTEKEEHVHEHEGKHEVVNEVTFIADKVGRFGFRCSRTCGSLHPFMVGTLIVEPNYLYSGALGLAIGLTLACLLYIKKRRT